MLRRILDGQLNSSSATFEYESNSIDESDFDEYEGEGDEDVLDHESQSPAKKLLLLLLVLHLLGILIWLRVWLRDRKVKAARTGKNTPPPQKQSCTYDIDNRYISKLELPLKALKLAKA
jgi:hypothetical protein